MRKAFTLAIFLFFCFLTSLFSVQVVFIIPGIMGSTMADSLSVIPRLPKPPVSPAQCPPIDTLKVHDPYGTVGWTWLVERLSEDPNKQIYEIPYDWRQTLDTIWRQYIKPEIDRRKLLDDERKVDIIAHSMGGLAVRAYIQSEAYEEDIRRLIMIGTPNEGYPGIYLMLEKGELRENKKIPKIFEVKNLISAMLDHIQLKESIVFEQILKGWAFLSPEADLLASGTVITKTEIGYRFQHGENHLFLRDEDIAREIKRIFPSLFSLLPIYPFLKSTIGYTDYVGQQPNELLDLNGQAGMKLWASRAGFKPHQIHVTLFLSDNGQNRTLRAISPADSEREYGSGDGTVLDTFYGASHFIEAFSESVTIIRGQYGDHMGLPGNEAIQQKIIALLSTP